MTDTAHDEMRRGDLARHYVTRGAAWLDATYPEWIDKIEPDDLNMAAGCDCILGQAIDEFVQGVADVVAYYTDGYHIIHGFIVEAGLDEGLTRANLDADTWMVDHGFLHGGGVSNEDLEAAWSHLVFDRAWRRP